MPRRTITRGVAALLVVLAAGLLAPLAVRDIPPPGAGAAPSQAPPPNDPWEGRVHWQPDYNTGGDTFPLDIATTNVEATTEPGEAVPCAPTGSTIWYEWYQDRSGTLTIDTAGSSFNTVLAVYTIANNQQLLPSPPGGNMVSIGCDDNALGLQSRVSVAVAAGSPIWIQVGGYNGEQGAVNIHAECACSPPNDSSDFAGDLYVDELTPERTAQASTVYATLEPNEPRPCGNIGATLWYTFYVPGNASLVLDTAGSDFDTALAVYRFETYPPFPGSTAIACNDNGPGAQARLTFTAEGGSQYYVQAGGANGATGNLKIRLACDPACPPYSDNWGQYSIAAPGIVETQTAGATLEQGEPRPCGRIDKTVWFGVSVPGNTRLRVDAAGSSFPVALAAYEATSVSPPPASLSLIDCETPSAGQAPSVAFDVEANITYWIQAGGVGGASGLLRLSFDCEPVTCPPYNDSQFTPSYLGVPYSFPYSESFDVRGATTEQGEDLSCGDMGATVWLLVQPGQTPTSMRFETDGSRHDTAMAVYEAPFQGAPFDQWTRVACSPVSPGQRASVEFTMQIDRAYMVQIGGRDGARSEYLEVGGDCVPACPPDNDNAGSAWYFQGGNSFSLNTRGATLEPAEERPCGNIGKTVWFGIPAGTEPVTYQLSTSGSNFATVMAIYAFEGFSPPGGAVNVDCGAVVALTLETRPNTSYLIQVGGVDEAGGDLQFAVTCDGCPSPGGGPVPVPDTGGGDGDSAAGTINPPETGNGGYLPPRRQD